MAQELPIQVAGVPPADCGPWAEGAVCLTRGRHPPWDSFRLFPSLVSACLPRLGVSA